eukprot:TRINITY_DN2533_c0_g6_i1.p1 TRINITY_DN2533_c0_g6~~TRINITY_DN2533_c0_g6_i1.p1  ORF type:complete len:456 (+),score=185.86 TRINITY_DN2533_c0_g6_i1:137-1369(+)
MPQVAPQDIVALKGKSKIRILSVDGGGIRGVVPALILEEMEKMKGKRVCEMFDIIAGTSTGGIVASMCALPAKVGSKEPSPKACASHLVELYMNRGEDIFPGASIADDPPDGDRGEPSAPRRRDLATRAVCAAAGKVATGVRGGYTAVRSTVSGSKYSCEGLEKTLAEYCVVDGEEVTLADMTVPVYIPAIEMGHGWGCVFFSSLDAQARGGAGGCNYKLADVLRATSAAPTFFPSKKLRNCTRGRHGALSDGDVELTCIDGGVNCNNPALAVLLYVRSIVGADVPIEVVSLGTGETHASYTEEQMTGWGAAQWIRPLIKTLLDGSSALAHKNIETIASGEPKVEYTRLQLDIPASLTALGAGRDVRNQGIALDAMDNVRKENLQALRQLVQESFLPQHRQTLRDLVGRL